MYRQAMASTIHQTVVPHNQRLGRPVTPRSVASPLARPFKLTVSCHVDRNAEARQHP